MPESSLRPPHYGSHIPVWLILLLLLLVFLLLFHH